MENTRDNRFSWIWGLILIALGGFFLLAQLTNLMIGDLIWAVIMGGISLTFLSVYLTNREQWWALIPSYVFAAIAGLVMLTMLNVNAFLGVDIIAVYVLSAIALPFLVVFLLNRRNWWALIPAYVMLAVVGLLIVEGSWLGRRLPGDVEGAYVMFAIALPFLFVFARNPRNWWALIPGGIMLAIGLGLFVDAFEYVIPAALIIGGLYMLARQAARGRDTVERIPERPKTGPEADRAPESEYEPLGTRETGPDADHA